MNGCLSRKDGKQYGKFISYKVSYPGGLLRLCSDLEERETRQASHGKQFGKVSVVCLDNAVSGSRRYRCQQIVVACGSSK